MTAIAAIGAWSPLALAVAIVALVVFGAVIWWALGDDEDLAADRPLAFAEWDESDDLEALFDFPEAA